MSISILPCPCNIGRYCFCSSLCELGCYSNILKCIMRAIHGKFGWSGLFPQIMILRFIRNECFICISISYTVDLCNLFSVNWISSFTEFSCRNICFILFCFLVVISHCFLSYNCSMVSLLGFWLRVLVCSSLSWGTLVSSLLEWTCYLLFSFSRYAMQYGLSITWRILVCIVYNTTNTYNMNLFFKAWHLFYASTGFLAPFADKHGGVNCPTIDNLLQGSIK